MTKSVHIYSPNPTSNYYTFKNMDTGKKQTFLDHNDYFYSTAIDSIKSTIGVAGEYRISVNYTSPGENYFYSKPIVLSQIDENLKIVDVNKNTSYHVKIHPIISSKSVKGFGVMYRDGINFTGMVSSTTIENGQLVYKTSIGNPTYFINQDNTIFITPKGMEHAIELLGDKVRVIFEVIFYTEFSNSTLLFGSAGALFKKETWTIPAAANATQLHIWAPIQEVGYVTEFPGNSMISDLEISNVFQYEDNSFSIMLTFNGEPIIENFDEENGALTFYSKRLLGELYSLSTNLKVTDPVMVWVT